MKKLMILAVAAIAMVGCTKTYEVEEMAQPAIGFGTWTETLTKSVSDPTNPRVQGTSIFRQGDGIVVYGSKNISSTDHVVFDGVDVVATAETDNVASTWDYNNHRFWDSNADSYTFFAVSPKNKLATTTTTATNGAFATNSLSFNGNENDFLVADKVVVNKGEGAASTYFNSYGTVNLTFNHAAALVDVHVKKAPALADATVKISAISLNNINKTGVLTIASGDYNKTISPRTTVPNITIAKWTASNTGSYIPTDGVTPVYGDNGTSAISNENQKTISTDTSFSTDNSTPNTTPAASTVLFNNLIVVPQAFTNPTEVEIANPASASTAHKISITYSITSGTDTNTYTSYLWLSQFDHIDNGTQAADFVGSWAPGKHYIFYITIDAHAITFSASISEWEANVNGYHHLVN